MSSAVEADAPLASSFPAWSFEPRDFFHFEIVYHSRRSRARVGKLHTPHGVVDTPGFVAVATNGALKALDHRVADEAGQQLMFCNTYHLLLHPGPEVIDRAGGLHRFINRSRPIITDSGGFQVFSLNHGSVHDEINMKSRKPTSRNKKLLENVTEEGATFRSYRDGQRILLTPESSVQAQKAYRSDIIIPLDELPPYHINRDELERSLNMTHRWEARSLQEHLRDVRHQAMYAVLHGGVDYELRQKSIDYLCSLPFDGYGIGGSLGKDRQELSSLLEYVMPRIPPEKPNHLLGIADVPSIEGAVPLGVDTFDSCFPTRMGRHGTVLTKSHGKINLSSGGYKTRFDPVDPEWGIQDFSLAYLHHLLKAFEPVASTLCTLQNIMFMSRYMENIRTKILNDEI